MCGELVTSSPLFHLLNLIFETKEQHSHTQFDDRIWEKQLQNSSLICNVKQVLAVKCFCSNSFCRYRVFPKLRISSCVIISLNLRVNLSTFSLCVIISLNLRVN